LIDTSFRTSIKKPATLIQQVPLLWILIKSIAKIEYKIRKEKRKSI